MQHLTNAHHFAGGVRYGPALTETHRWPRAREKSARRLEATEVIHGVAVRRGRGGDGPPKCGQPMELSSALLRRASAHEVQEGFEIGQKSLGLLHSFSSALMQGHRHLQS